MLHPNLRELSAANVDEMHLKFTQLADFVMDLVD